MDRRKVLKRIQHCGAQQKDGYIGNPVLVVPVKEQDLQPRDTVNVKVDGMVVCIVEVRPDRSAVWLPDDPDAIRLMDNVLSPLDMCEKMMEG